MLRSEQFDSVGLSAGSYWLGDSLHHSCTQVECFDRSSSRAFDRVQLSCSALEAAVFSFCHSLHGRGRSASSMLKISSHPEE